MIRVGRGSAVVSATQTVRGHQTVNHVHSQPSGWKTGYTSLPVKRRPWVFNNLGSPPAYLQHKNLCASHRKRRVDLLILCVALPGPFSSRTFPQCTLCDCMGQLKNQKWLLVPHILKPFSASFLKARGEAESFLKQWKQAPPPYKDSPRPLPFQGWSIEL